MKAVLYLSSPGEDFENAAKEAVSSLESLVKTLTGRSDFTRAVKDAAQEGLIPRPIDEMAIKIFAYPLQRRGDLTVWLADDALESWRAPVSGKPGGQRTYADIAIEAALTIGMLFHLPLRQTEGFLHCLAELRCEC